jgi:hypothetical protein
MIGPEINPTEMQNPYNPAALSLIRPSTYGFLPSSIPLASYTASITSGMIGINKKPCTPPENPYPIKKIQKLLGKKGEGPVRNVRIVSRMKQTKMNNLLGTLAATIP